MENLNNRDFRAIMFYNYKRGLNAAECTAEMFSALGELAPTKTTVYKWYSRFRLGYMCLDDEDPDARLRRSLMKISSRWRN